MAAKKKAKKVDQEEGRQEEEEEISPIDLRSIRLSRLPSDIHSGVSDEQGKGRGLRKGAAAKPVLGLRRLRHGMPQLESGQPASASCQPKNPRKGQARKIPRPPKPIELYYWPTPNGHKISILLEELKLPYVDEAGEYRQGRAVRPRFPENLAQQPHAGHHRPGGPGRQAGLDLRIRGDPAISRPQDRQDSIPRTSAPAWRWRNGCSGRWAASVPWRGRPTISSIMPRKTCPTPRSATPTRCTACSG